MIRYQFSSLPPSTNNLFANILGKGRVKSKRYRAWLDMCGKEIQLQGKKRIHGHVSLNIGLVAPDARKRDLSNAIKPIEDLLVSMQVIDDDSLVRRLSVHWLDAGMPVTVLIQQHEEALAA